MRTARAMMVGTLAALAACGGGGDDGGGGGTEPGVFTTLAVTPTTATVVVGGTQTLTASARDQNGATMSGLTTTFTSGNNAIATVNSTSGVITGVAPGSTTIAVNGTVGTVTKTQNVPVTVTVPSNSASVAATASNQFTPATVTVTRNGSVTWSFAAQHNVTFDTQGAPAGIGTRESGTASITFPNAGTFAYHCTIHGAGMSGTVVVQ
jgi:trimeric autotransporter adhesin